MAFVFRLPDIGEGISEAEIVESLVAEGDVVAEHQLLLRIETDKALVEIPAPTAGRIGKIRHHSGDSVRVGEVLVSICAEGENDDPAADPPNRSSTVVGSLPEAAVDLPPHDAPPSQGHPAVVLATPGVRRLARERGVRIEDVRGTGLGGRVTEADLREQELAPMGADAAAQTRPPSDTDERVTLHGVRRTIARRLKTAVVEAALATHMDEIDVTPLLQYLEQHDTLGGLFACVIKAAAQALRTHLHLNATFDATHEELRIRRDIHIGVAVDTPNSLMVPVVRHTDKKSVADIEAEVALAATLCRERTADIRLLRGGTFSMSNIGAIGGMFATPIPNYPEVAILATGRTVERLARVHDGSIVTHILLPVSLSFDHRAVDGADVARFVNTLRGMLMHPDQLITCPSTPRSVGGPKRLSLD